MKATKKVKEFPYENVYGLITGAFFLYLTLTATYTIFGVLFGFGFGTIMRVLTTRVVYQR